MNYTSKGSSLFISSQKVKSEKPMDHGKTEGYSELSKEEDKQHINVKMK